jgi:FtsP/CotA-like multicopper oxidase with cupredoxin domain
MPKRKKRTHRLELLLLVPLILFVFVLLAYFVDLNPKWTEPAVLQSKNGVLDVALDAKKTKVSVGGKEQESNVYNGKYINDTWEVKGGDTINVHLKNHTSEPTNLHFHGGHVSPKGNSDNVLLDIKPGETFDYTYKLSANHPPGLYWYHPHLHHYTDEQVMGGMLGAIRVKGSFDELPGIKGVPEKLLVLTTQDPANSNTVNRLVNNQVKPTLYVRPLETVRLEIVNASADDFYDFAIPGQKLHIISRDGNTLSRVDNVDHEVMAPGDRIQVLFKAGWWGEYDVKSLKFNEGFFVYPQDTFMKIKVSGIPVIPQKLPRALLPYDDFRNAHIDNTRTLTFSEGGTNNNPTFLLDGKMFDPNVVSQVMVLGTTEEWRLVNDSSEYHPFHIHINPFQVISVNGKEIERYGYDDTFPVPPHGNVVIRTKYKDFDGKYVLHCHILFHEDHGMMQVVEVVKPGNQPAADNGMLLREGMPEMGNMQNTTMPSRYSKPVPAMENIP